VSRQGRASERLGGIIAGRCSSSSTSSLDWSGPPFAVAASSSLRISCSGSGSPSWPPDPQAAAAPPARAPRANAVAERVIDTGRRECLDHLLVVNEHHLRIVLAEFADDYDRERLHRTLRLETPPPASRSPTGPIRVRPVLGGLHDVYVRAA
jgi:Integrase core domain